MDCSTFCLVVAGGLGLQESIPSIGWSKVLALNFEGEGRERKEAGHMTRWVCGLCRSRFQRDGFVWLVAPG